MTTLGENAWARVTKASDFTDTERGSRTKAGAKLGANSHRLKAT